MRKSLLAAILAAILVVCGVAAAFGAHAWRGRCAAQFPTVSGGPLPPSYAGSDVGRAARIPGVAPADDNAATRAGIARTAMKRAEGTTGLGPLTWYRAIDASPDSAADRMRLLGAVDGAAVLGSGSATADGALVFVGPDNGRERRALTPAGLTEDLAHAGDRLVAAQSKGGSTLVAAFTDHGDRVWCSRVSTDHGAGDEVSLDATNAYAAVLEHRSGRAGYLALFDAEGRKLWGRVEPQPWQSLVTMSGGLVMESAGSTDVLATDGTPQSADDVTMAELVARDAKTGSVAWRYHYTGSDGAIWPTILLTTAGDIAIAYADRPATSSEDKDAGQAVVVGIDRDGNQLWQQPAWRWLATPAGDRAALASDDLVIVPTAGDTFLTEISALDPHTGTVQWRLDPEIPGTASSAPEPVNATDLANGVIHDGRVYLPNRNLTVLDADTGRTLDVVGVHSDVAPNLDLGVRRVVATNDMVLVDTAFGLFGYHASS